MKKLGIDSRTEVSREAPASAPPVGAPTETDLFEKASRYQHQAEAQAILSALTTARWNRKRAAALLNMDYKALLYKMKKIKIA
jgi:DNA-binding NtrC family response regulator